jgi:D-serine deaminase-like pyridoxal phosphate-dependent protein
MDLQSEAKEYTVSVRTNDIHEAIAKTGTALAALVDEALLSHEPHEIDEECEFEEFARDLLRVLTSHSDELASSEDAPDADISLS